MQRLDLLMIMWIGIERKNLRQSLMAPEASVVRFVTFLLCTSKYNSKSRFKNKLGNVKSLYSRNYTVVYTNVWMNKAIRHAIIFWIRYCYVCVIEMFEVALEIQWKRRVTEVEHSLLVWVVSLFRQSRPPDISNGYLFWYFVYQRNRIARCQK